MASERSIPADQILDNVPEPLLLFQRLFFTGKYYWLARQATSLGVRISPGAGHRIPFQSTLGACFFRVGVEVDNEPLAFHAMFGHFHCPRFIQCIVVRAHGVACPRVVVEKLRDSVVEIPRRDGDDARVISRESASPCRCCGARQSSPVTGTGHGRVSIGVNIGSRRCIVWLLG